MADMTLIPPLTREARQELAKALGIPICSVCSARHPPVSPPEQPLTVPRDDPDEATRRIRLHVMAIAKEHPEGISVAAVATQLGISLADPS